MQKPSLPIDAILPDILSALASPGANLILQATPGSGKTTRVPQALLTITQKQILVLEPRRLAAQLSAQRIAAELNEACGETVGFQIRFERLESEKTRIKFITEGLFLKLMMGDPQLNNVDCVIIDEFHERHLYSDVTLMLVKKLQETRRNDLKIVVMSATLDVESLSRYLENAKIIDLKTKIYPVDIEYLPQETKTPLELLVLDAVKKELNSSREGKNILVFLPGSREITRAQEALSPLKSSYDFEIFPLKGDLPPSEQQKVFAPTAKRKVILSTNVAETSLTIEGVNCVIDSGLARIAGHASWSGLSTLDMKPISQASCIQRAGRSGRNGPGSTKRLFTQYDYSLRNSFEKPEIQRLDLTHMMLDLKILENRFSQDKTGWQWFEAPPSNNIASCHQILCYLGALDAALQITELGVEMAKYPFHPRFAKILVEAKKKNHFAFGFAVVTLISEGMLFKKGSDAPDYSHSDIEQQLHILKSLINKEKIEEKYRHLIDYSNFSRIEKYLKHFSAQYKFKIQECFHEHSSLLTLLLLKAFPDRICQTRKVKLNKENKIEVNLCGGGGASLAKSSSVQDSEFFIAIDAEESSLGTTRANAVQIRVAHAIEPDILLAEGASEFVTEKVETLWDAHLESVQTVERTYYGKLILEEKTRNSFSRETEELLYKKLSQEWPKPFFDTKDLDFFKVRCHIAQTLGFSLNLPNFSSEEDLLLLFQHICEGKKSYKEILQKELSEYIEDLLSFEEKDLLNKIAPSKITIGRNFKVTVNYEEGKPPWIASRLQNFFGSLETPKIGNGRLGTIIHLLAPNGQALQVTSDLKGFWERVYPTVRKELMRKYPRHSWPEDPINAAPPEIKPRR